MEMLQYEFMRRGLLVGVLLGVIIPCIGVVVVLKRLSMIGDALSHTSLAGVAAGLLLGVNPVLGAVVACVLGALSIEGIRKKVPRYAELSIAVILSAGVGLAGVLSGLLPGSANFNSFLFGSIVAIDNGELALVIGISGAVLVGCVVLYRALFALAFDERGARLVGVPVRVVNFLFTLMTAVSISVAARTVGALMVSSLMVLPVACALSVAGSYRQMLLYAGGFGVFFTTVGLTVSFYAGLRPGGAIVLTGVVFLLVLLAVRSRKGKGGGAGG